MGVTALREDSMNSELEKQLLQVQLDAALLRLANEQASAKLIEKNRENADLRYDVLVDEKAMANNRRVMQELEISKGLPEARVNAELARHEMTMKRWEKEVGNKKPQPAHKK
jgi:hypothetical protein